MEKILILPDVLCNQIAAGEVIERPAAVVKELLENSIDAGSSRISVALQQGGRKEIRIVDNGSGMDRDNALLAIERHATSKIRDMQDLQSVKSLGFRGEALPSITAVSRFEMVTRTEREVSGTFLRVEGGIVREVQDKGAPAGTVITVRDLFFNLPARRKFLRTMDTELGHINDQFQRLALAHPGIHFQLNHQDRVICQYPSAADSLQRATQVLGLELVRQLRPFSLERANIRLKGYLSLPHVQRTSGQAIFAFMNGRPIWDRLVNRSVLGAYESLLPKGRFPVVLLYMDVLPELVDVNVHPTKREVRFRGPGEIMETIRLALREALKGKGSITATPAETSLEIKRDLERGKNPGEGEESTEDWQDSGAKPFSPSPSREEVRPVPRQLSLSSRGGPEEFPAAPLFQEKVHEMLPVASPEEEKKDEGVGPFSRFRILGQVAQAYIVLESFHGMMFIDQHAAHERIIYDRLRSPPSPEPSQRLLRSAVVEVLPRQAAMLKRWLQELRDLGFDVEPFGGNSFVVHAMPAIVSRCSPEELIRELVEGAHEEETRPRWELPAQIAKTAACHHAVKAGQRLSHEEIRHLLKDLDRTAFPSTCPHGRPLWFEMSREEMAQRFQRK